MSSPQRIALIAGGNRGIGRSAAIHLAKDGVDSVITYRSHAEEAAEVVAAIEALGARPRRSAATRSPTTSAR
jgi:NAD(P)-dependent dehydrogenase (short-subunit alcohol dehydrogenase family)